MSSPSQTAAPSSIFKSMLDAALAEYQKKTGDDLLAHWLVAELQTCESVDGVLNILRDQAKAFEQSGDEKLMKWIDPLVHVLYTFSGALGDGVSLAFPPAKVIFTGIGVLLAAAKDVRASHGAIIDLFERVESFFKRLGVYNQISLTTEMAEVLVKIVIELLSILSIATKEVKRRRARIFGRKLLGRTDIEDALKRLDSLIQEEFQMVTAQILKVATEAKDDADKANAVIQQNMEEVKRDVEEVKWTQIEQDIHKWLSPPDPSTNYNIACETHQEGTAAWFFQDEKFKYWTENASLLWIHGKPGSGKSILCSAIIKYLMSLRDGGQAALAFFYFDFRDKDKKQDFRNFITSLLVQLSAYSTQCCKIISRIYSTHGKGTREPSKDALMVCLREMLLVAALQPLYIVVDALDECPNASGIPTPREVVLKLLEDLVRLDLRNLHICVSSRPEIDIKRAIEPLPHSPVSLHDESGQKRDISNYVSTVVYADRNMRSWRDEEKQLVVNELTKRADGMFRWVYCQLEVLRHCFPANIRQTLRELPESLDETYARVLRDINKANQGHAHRMLQCLMVAVRPLSVEELAELLAFGFDAAKGGIPKYRSDWRLGDQTQAVLSTCSSLVAIVKDRQYGRRYGRQVVQFSHFSVKEFLMSDRLTSPLGDFSRYRIRPGPAHTLLTQACLGYLLHLGGHTVKESVKDFPLAEYAAQHWVKHAQFGDVASHVKDGMETLFDAEKPHFATWVGIFNIDEPFEWFTWGIPNPLYYSALCGFYDLVNHLATKCPHNVNASYGRYRFPLLAALSEGHVEVAELLLKHGANVNVRETTGETILLKAFSWSPNLVDKMKFLLEHGADVDARDGNLMTSLHLAEVKGEFEVAEILVEHKADVNSQNNEGKTPLHILLERRVYTEDDVLNHARLLLEHGAEVNKRDKGNRTPLHLAIKGDWFKIARILLENGADAGVENNDGKTPLHLLSESRIRDTSNALDLIWPLLEHGATVNRRDKSNRTPLHLAIGGNWFKLAQILLGKGADVSVENNDGKTLLHLLSDSRIHDEGDALDLMRLLLEHGTAVNRRDKGNQTPLLLAMRRDWFKLTRILLEYGADASVENNDGKTPLHLLLESRLRDEGDALDLIWLLLEHGATVNRRDKSNQTPSHLAIGRDWFKLAQILLEHGADANAENNNDKTPLHILSERDIYGESGVNEVLDHTISWLVHGAEVNRRYRDNETLLLLEIGAFESMKNKTSETSVCHVPRGPGQYDSRELLLERCVNTNAQDEDHTTPPQLQANFGPVQIALALLNHGADVNAGNHRGENSLYQELKEQELKRGETVCFRNRNRPTPLHLASLHGRLDIARVLLDRGATANSEDHFGRTPLHLLSKGTYNFEQDYIHVARLLLQRGGEVNTQDKDRATPLHSASYYGRVAIARVLLDHGAAANSKGNQGMTPLHSAARGVYLYSEDDGIRVTQLLLERGADVNVPDDDNRTPLHLASYFGRVEIVLVLLNAGANPGAEDTQGQTPLHLVLASQGPYCSQGDDFGVARLLLERGANVNARDKNQATPSDLASCHGKTKIASLLLHYGGKTNAEIDQDPTSRQLGSEGVNRHCPPASILGATM